MSVTGVAFFLTESVLWYLIFPFLPGHWLRRLKRFCFVPGPDLQFLQSDSVRLRLCWTSDLQPQVTRVTMAVAAARSSYPVRGIQGLRGGCLHRDRHSKNWRLSEHPVLVPARLVEFSARRKPLARGRAWTGRYREVKREGNCILDPLNALC